MFFQQAFKGRNHWKFYLLVTGIVFVGYQIGTLPLLMALWKKTEDSPDLGQSDIEQFATNPDFTQFDMNTNLGLTLMLLMFVAALVVFYFVFTPVHKREFRSLTTPSSKINWSKIFFAFFVWLGLALSMEMVSYFFSPESYSIQFQLNTFLPLLALCVLVLPIQTSFEELFFRGYLMQGFGTMKKSQIMSLLIAGLLGYIYYKWLGDPFSRLIMNTEILGSNNGALRSIFIFLTAIGASMLTYSIFKRILASDNERELNIKILPLIMTSILFGLIHSANPEIEKFGFGIMQFYYISAGLLLGIMTIMDDGLELALGTHAATNFASAVFVGYDGGALKTESIFVSHALNTELMTVLFVILGAVFLFILSKKYNWGSFSKILDTISRPDEDQLARKYLKTDNSIIDNV